MKTKQSQVFLDELGGLTTVQRTALKSSNSADDIASLLEAEFAKAPACGHCGAETFSKRSVTISMKRYLQTAYRCGST